MILQNIFTLIFKLTNKKKLSIFDHIQGVVALIMADAKRQALDGKDKIEILMIPTMRKIEILIISQRRKIFILIISTRRKIGISPFQQEEDLNFIVSLPWRKITLNQTRNFSVSWRILRC